MNTRRARLGLAVVLTIGAAMLTAACGSDDAKDTADGPVTITVNALPPDTDPVNRKAFQDSVKAFEAANPNIKIDAREGKMDPATFTTRLAGGQLEDVFYVYFTDPANLIAKKQVADITPYLGEISSDEQIRPDLMKVFTGPDGKVYGLPWTNYSMGLLYNRKLFTQAGLDPAAPPKTWEEVREAAKKIAALGSGYVGYGDYSKSNTGGWHFTAELYSIGGQVAKKDGDTWKADFNNDKGKQVLQQLKDMRWTDNSMGQRQLLEWADLLQLMAGGKLGMYVATSDNIPTIVNQFKGNFADYGLGSVPGGQGTLAGGDGFMFNAKATPAKIKAGLKWLAWEFNNPDRIEEKNKIASDAKLPVGLPEPAIWSGAAADKQAAASKKYANVPTENYAPFVAGMTSVPLKTEPPAAQQVYAVLDAAMAKVLTDKNADIAALLADAEKQINAILAAVK
ncbi:ABC-type glycerol-3-phosphate transport system substrate-binding protein [Allocatelliglobosispora scoriae]|uniref:ABC-type glycerol-3-phosphate transport system substrate-binding protein n=1 Tax=Allocatelliglobosispora scoriae TaxID=643052 RepID=A0A841BRC9_9ACTN|nr:extracellular solute-binding protein [Allocatelliglobosispora scoriae]MBB5869302.1 ABC-type glycerol-3-phosphate transport system substrate-binding protein [Allocatelliglobosispora scoriae]